MVDLYWGRNSGLWRSVCVSGTDPPAGYKPCYTNTRQAGHSSAGKSNGKSTTLYTLLVNDIAHGAQGIVYSTHYTPFHHEDQQIDLRPLAGHFEAYWEHTTIAAALHRAGEIIDERMQRYRANQDVGHDITLYIGEWGSIERVLGKKEAANLLIQIIDEGRKTRVWIGAIELHSLLVSRFGSDSAFREAFRTRLAGNVDDVTWKTVVGRDIPKQKVAVGTWMTDSGIATIERPVYRAILDLAATSPHSCARLVEPAEQLKLLTHLLENTPASVKISTAPSQVVSATGINEESAISPVIPVDTTTRDTSINDEILRAAIWKWLTVDEFPRTPFTRRLAATAMLF